MSRCKKKLHRENGCGNRPLRSKSPIRRLSVEKLANVREGRGDEESQIKKLKILFSRMFRKIFIGSEDSKFTVAYELGNSGSV